ncbi:MAG TPA: hypothetical protein GXX71_00420 [Acholeplasma sp.]|jgi:hypothetical protein|nr:hypothetical protein [Acholeplasmatales bacterium]HHV33150.1 hypothetical protein [Acholeplasma sp.]
MVSLEYFLDNKLEDGVMDIIIYLEDGSLLTDPNYEDYKVRSVKHEEREDGKYCIIIVE